MTTPAAFQLTQPADPGALGHWVQLHCQDAAAGHAERGFEPVTAALVQGTDE